MSMTEPTLRIFHLVGIKHSGKSNVGSYAAGLLSKRIATSFIDSDDLVLRHVPSIREFYRERGPDAFKELEYASMESFLRHEVPSEGILLIATGGGACDNGPLVELMQSTGTIVYLEVSMDVLFKRIMAKGLPPFLSEEDPSGSFERLHSRRDARYRQISDFVLRLSDYRSIAENGKMLADFILGLIGRGESCLETPLDQRFR